MSCGGQEAPSSHFMAVDASGACFPRNRFVPWARTKGLDLGKPSINRKNGGGLPARPRCNRLSTASLRTGGAAVQHKQSRKWRLLGRSRAWQMLTIAVHALRCQPTQRELKLTADFCGEESRFSEQECRWQSI